jgi:alpha-tubulin suppressor-like RCC1 family protein
LHCQVIQYLEKSLTLYKVNGEVYVFGKNDVGQIGLGGVTSVNVPTKLTGLPTITAISAGHYHSLLLTGIALS